jgi:hypothetical protein
MILFRMGDYFFLLVKVFQGWKIDGRVRIEQFDCLRALQGNVMQSSSNSQVTFFASGRFLQTLHCFTAAMHNQIIVIAQIGDNGVVTHRTLVGENRTVRRLPGTDFKNMFYNTLCLVSAVRHSPTLKRRPFSS